MKSRASISPQGDLVKLRPKRKWAISHHLYNSPVEKDIDEDLITPWAPVLTTGYASVSPVLLKGINLEDTNATLSEMNLSLINKILSFTSIARYSQH